MNALREAQFKGIDLVIWQKFGYGPQLFEQYYKKQRILDLEEWPALLSTLQKPLPLTFRVSAFHPGREPFLEELMRKYDVTPLCWMLDRSGMQASAARKGLSQTDLGAFLQVSHETASRAP